MAAGLETHLRERKMSLRRRRDVHDIRLAFRQHDGEVAVTAFHAAALTQLPGHEDLTVANGDDLASGNATDCRDMLVGDLAASDNGDSEHGSMAGGFGRAHRGQGRRKVHAWFPAEAFTEPAIGEAVPFPFR